jgi:hypothetical protein
VPLFVIHAFAVLRTPIDLLISADHTIGRVANRAKVSNTSALLRPGVYIINAIDASSKDTYDIAVEFAIMHSSPEQHGAAKRFLTSRQFLERPPPEFQNAATLRSGPKLGIHMCRNCTCDYE